MSEGRERRRSSEEELAHALYTVAKHHAAQHAGSSLIKDRIRGAVNTVPWLLERYPDLLEALATERSIICEGCGVDLCRSEHEPDCPTAARGL